MRYKYVKRKGHPIAPASGRIPEHRLILWEKIGPGTHPCHHCSIPVAWSSARTAAGCLNVDHLDGNTTNNNPDNLVPSCHTCNVTRARDQRFVDGLYIIIDGKRQKAVSRICLTCNRVFLIALKHIGRGNQGRYCSMQCVYKRSR